MKISNEGLELIECFEGCQLKAYRCPAGVWTIGYGHTKGVYQGMTITKAQAKEFLRADCSNAENNVNKYNNIYHWTQNEFDAMVSFAFNLGSINQLTDNGKRSKDVIAKKILEYNKAGGKVLKGLVSRREAEQKLFLKSSSTTSANNTTITVLKLGLKGEAVKKLQTDLSIRGYQVGTIDGDFGSKTKNAVIAFQKDSCLITDGIVGEKTLKAFDRIKVYSLAKDGSKQISANFTLKEFKCNDGSDSIIIDETFVKTTIQTIRDHFKSPITINSAYRTPTYNKKVGGASNSYHVKGRAFDIVVKGHTPNEVAAYARSIGVKGVIEYNTFVHVDSRPTKYWARNNNGKVTTVK